MTGMPFGSGGGQPPRPGFSMLGAVGPGAPRPGAPPLAQPPAPGNPLAGIDPKMLAQGLKKLFGTGTPDTPSAGPRPAGLPDPSNALAPALGQTPGPMDMPDSMVTPRGAPTPEVANLAGGGASGAGFMDWLKRLGPGLFGAGGVPPTFGGGRQDIGGLGL